jgi:HRDC domain
VLPGHCLSELVTRMPLDGAELASIDGLGGFRVARYGDALIGAIRGPAEGLLHPSMQSPP